MVRVLATVVRPDGGRVDEVIARTNVGGAENVSAPGSFSQVAGAIYTPNWGYCPLAPWAGFGVECAWAAAALILAGCLLRRRDG